MSEVDRSLPDLVYAKLEDLGLSKRYAYAAVIKDFILETLTRYGPLPLDGLTYFIGKNYPIVSRKDDISFTVLIYSDEIPNEGVCFYTPEQLAADVKLQIPAPINYATAYYHLFELFTLLREHPELAGTPLSMLEELFPKRYTRTDI